MWSAYYMSSPGLRWEPGLPCGPGPLSLSPRMSDHGVFILFYVSGMKRLPLGGFCPTPRDEQAFSVETWVVTLDSSPSPAPATSRVKRQPDAAMFCAARLFSSSHTSDRPTRAGSGVDSWIKAQNLKASQEAMLTQPGTNRWWWWPINFPFWNLNWEISTDRFSAVGSEAISKHRHRSGLRLLASKWWGSRAAEKGNEAHYHWCISLLLMYIILFGKCTPVGLSFLLLMCFGVVNFYLLQIMLL